MSKYHDDSKYRKVGDEVIVSPQRLYDDGVSRVQPLH